MDQKKKVTEAVNLLVSAPNYSSLVRELTRIIETWDTHPMAYDGHLSSLNALIDLGLANRDAFERMLKLVESKRRLVPEVKRVDYQRSLMRERRARLAKALELQAIRKPFANAAAKSAYAKEVQARWKQARDEYVKSKGPSLSWTERNEASAEFWARIDAQLDQNLRESRVKPR